MYRYSMPLLISLALALGACGINPGSTTTGRGKTEIGGQFDPALEGTQTIQLKTGALHLYIREAPAHEPEKRLDWASDAATTLTYENLDRGPLLRLGDGVLQFDLAQVGGDGPLEPVLAVGEQASAQAAPAALVAQGDDYFLVASFQDGRTYCAAVPYHGFLPADLSPEAGAGLRDQGCAPLTVGLIDAQVDDTDPDPAETTYFIIDDLYPYLCYTSGHDWTPCVDGRVDLLWKSDVGMSLVSVDSEGYLGRLGGATTILGTEGGERISLVERGPIRRLFVNYIDQDIQPLVFYIKNDQGDCLIHNDAGELKFENCTGLPGQYWLVFGPDKVFGDMRSKVMNGWTNRILTREQLVELADSLGADSYRFEPRGPACCNGLTGEDQGCGGGSVDCRLAGSFFVNCDKPQIDSPSGIDSPACLANPNNDDGYEFAGWEGFTSYGTMFSDSCKRYYSKAQCQAEVDRVAYWGIPADDEDLDVVSCRCVDVSNGYWGRPWVPGMEP